MVIPASPPPGALVGPVSEIRHLCYGAPTTNCSAPGATAPLDRNASQGRGLVDGNDIGQPRTDGCRCAPAHRVRTELGVPRRLRLTHLVAYRPG